MSEDGVPCVYFALFPSLLSSPSLFLCRAGSRLSTTLMVGASCSALRHRHASIALSTSSLTVCCTPTHGKERPQRERVFGCALGRAGGWRGHLKNQRFKAGPDILFLKWLERTNTTHSILGATPRGGRPLVCPCPWDHTTQDVVNVLALMTFMTKV